MAASFRIRTLALRFALGLPCLCAAQQPASPLLQSLAAAHHVCAAALAVIRHQQLQSVEVASGCDPALPLDADSVFEAASLGKPVFAYAVLKLAQQGRLDLDRPLVEHLPEGYLHRQNPFDTRPTARTDAVTDPRLGLVTARMVLNHTSGLPNWSNGPLHFDFDPGSRWQYSGEGYLLLQRVVEQVSGQPLQDFMRAQVFEPLGMPHSAYVRRADADGTLVPSIAADGTPRKLKPFAVAVAPASLYTSAADYGRFMAALLGDAALLERITAAPVPVSEAPALEWGLGWGIENTAGGRFIWQWGHNPGYRSFAMASASGGDGFVLLTDSDEGQSLAEPIAAALLPGPHPLVGFPMLR